MAGDRVLAFRFNDAGPLDDLKWRPKTQFASLQHAPTLARLKSRYDSQSKTLTLRMPNGDDGTDPVEIRADIEDDGDRRRIESAVTRYLLETSPRSPFASRSRHQPLRLVGDGARGVFHDTAAGRVTLHSAASMAQLAKALGVETLADSRFRSNIVIDGEESWQEFQWAGRRVVIGETEFKVVKPVVRCLATHANPSDGERDLDIMNTLTRVIGQPEPRFAVSLVPTAGGGEIRLGDKIEIA